MPVSFEGLTYERYLFKAVENSETGGCHADVYLPDTPLDNGHPIALNFHGGAFCIGDTMHVCKDHTKYLLDRGFCVVSAEYRLAPHARLRHQREDWLDSYRWIKNELRAITGGRVDHDKVFCFGGSAGGTAALYLAQDSIGSGLQPLQAVYVLYPALKWDAPGRRHQDYAALEEILSKVPSDQRALVTEMIDGPVATAYDLKTETKRPMTGRRIWHNIAFIEDLLMTCMLESANSPFPPSTSLFELVTASFPPTVFVKAGADTLIPPSDTDEFYERLQSLGVECKMIDAKDMTHGAAEEMDHQSAEGDRYWHEVFNVALDWAVERTSSASMP